MPRKRFAMPSQCRCALPLDRSTKACWEIKEKGKVLIRLFLASGLYLLHCVVKSSRRAVDSREWGEGERVGEMHFSPLLATCPLISPIANTTVCDSQS